MCEYCDVVGSDNIWYLDPKVHVRRLYRLRERTDPGASVTMVNPGLGDWEPISEIIRLKETDPESYKNKLEEHSRHIGAMTQVQVVPPQDALKIVEIASPVVAVTCVCRAIYRGLIPKSQDDFTCMGLGMGMLRWARWPQRYIGTADAGGPKYMSVDESKDWLQAMNKKGFVHCVGQEHYTVTMICNCSYPECMCLRRRIDYGIKGAVLKSHYIAMLDADRCNGCLQCAHRCYFGALTYDPAMGIMYLDPHRCYGCGLCETACNRGAITLRRREEFPGLRDEW